MTMPLPKPSPKPSPKSSPKRLPSEPCTQDAGPGSDADRERGRVRLARKWAYLISTTSYVPLAHTDLERPMLEMVHEIFAALAREPLGLDVADGVGARLVELNCVDKSSLQCTVDVLGGALLADRDLTHLERLPERVLRLFGALAAGYAEAIRRRTAEQQDSMYRALMAVAKKAMRAAESRQTDFTDTSTELVLLRRQLSHQLLHDPLTGLPNRQFFSTRLEEVLNSGTPTTLYRVRLNGFSVVGDGLGGPRTDTLLTALSVRLRAALAGEHAMLARFDRADFTVLQECTPTTSQPVEVIGKLTEALAETTYVADLGLALSANIGVVQSPPHRSNPVELLQAADIALRHAEEQGPGQWRLLGLAEDLRDRRLLRLAAIMPGALETGQLAVGYRLRVGLADERPACVAAFARWQHAGLQGRRCVALAEQTGLSPQVGQWLLRSACEQLSSWHGISGTDLPLAVSLSPNQAAAPELVDTVLEALADTELRADLLRVAMPAAEVFDGREQAAENLASLADAGVHAEVHHFGGGPSDLARLADLPLRTVWLMPGLAPRSRGADEETVVAKALTGLVELVHSAGAAVAVDGVRTRAEADWWRGAGADTAAGPLFSAVMGPSDIASLFRDSG
jgi:diguanylate cyclase (GGDEF)-like protein